MPTRARGRSEPELAAASLGRERRGLVTLPGGEAEVSEEFSELLKSAEYHAFDTARWARQSSGSTAGPRWLP